jgi:hypothetical protein
VADKDGKTIGGHMMDGCLVYTTAEIVIGEANDLVFFREEDSTTHLKELKIAPKPTEPDDQERVNKKYPK